MKTKAELRAHALQQRKLLSPRDVAHVSRKISEQLEELVDWSNVSTLHTYLPITENNEIDTTLFLAWLEVAHPEVEVYVSSYNSQSKTLQHATYNPKLLAKDAHGIPTPTNVDNGLDTIQFDVILVPCLVTDSANHRIGYGAGIYDRFLASQPRAHSIGLAFGLLRVDAIPADTTDIALSQILIA